MGDRYIDPAQAQIFGQSLQNHGLDQVKQMLGFGQPQQQPVVDPLNDPMAKARQVALQRMIQGQSQ